MKPEAKTRQFIKNIKRLTRRKFTAEEKIRIVLEDFRRDISIRDWCYREGIQPSTYYDWLKDFREAGKDRLTRETVRDATRTKVPDIKRENARLKQLVELSLQMYLLKKRPYLVWKVTDSGHTYVSGSTVYRILKREGLIKPAEIIGFKTAKKYRHKTKRPNEFWASDCCHPRVIDGDCYYLETVMDDFSHFILSWYLKIDMAGGSLEDVIQQAVDLTGMTDVPLEDRTVLLSDNGAGYISQQYRFAFPSPD